MRTGDRLGVETPVGRIFVLGPALGAHRKAGHRRPRSIVGQPLDDRPARAAVRAIRERITVASLGRVLDFGQALGAGGQIGRDRRPWRGGFCAAADPEHRRPIGLTGGILGGLLLDFDGVDAGLGRMGMTKRVEKGIQRGAVALHLDPHRVGLVAHPTGQSAAAGPSDRRRGEIRLPGQYRAR